MWPELTSMLAATWHRRPESRSQGHHSQSKGVIFYSLHNGIHARFWKGE